MANKQIHPFLTVTQVFPSLSGVTWLVLPTAGFLEVADSRYLHMHLDAHICVWTYVKRGWTYFVGSGVFCSTYRFWKDPQILSTSRPLFIFVLKLWVGVSFQYILPALVWLRLLDFAWPILQTHWKALINERSLLWSDHESDKKVFLQWERSTKYSFKCIQNVQISTQGYSLPVVDHTVNCSYSNSIAVFPWDAVLTLCSVVRK